MILDSPLRLGKFHLHEVFLTGWKLDRDGFIGILFCPGAIRSFSSSLRDPGRFRGKNKAIRAKQRNKTQVMNLPANQRKEIKGMRPNQMIKDKARAMIPSILRS